MRVSATFTGYGSVTQDPRARLRADPLTCPLTQLTVMHGISNSHTSHVPLPAHVTLIQCYLLLLMSENIARGWGWGVPAQIDCVRDSLTCSLKE